MKRSFLYVCLMGLLFSSCSSIDDLKSRVDTLESTVSDLKSATTSLQEAYDGGKVITNVTATQEGNGGWVVAFSDNSSITVLNGSDGVTPYLKTDQDGYLTVSYDKGATFSRLLDNDGNPLFAAVRGGVDVSVNNDGYYVFTVIDSKTNETEEIVTPLSSSSSLYIKSISEDESTNIVTIEMADGQTFTFNKVHVYPSSIAILTTEAINITADGTASFLFRVNPQTATFNYDLESDECQIALDKVGNVNKTIAPDGYKLTSVEQCYDEQGTLIQGQYKATLTDQSASSDYDDQTVLVISSTDANNNDILVSSSAFRVRFSSNTITSFAFTAKANSAVLKDVQAVIDGNTITAYSPYITDPSQLVATFSATGTVLVENVEQVSGATPHDFSSCVYYKVVSADGESNTYTVNVRYSGLPVMEINTPDAVSITSKDDWTKKVTYSIIKPDGQIDCSGTMQMKGRGNTTWNYPKKPYAIKLDDKTEILGLAKEKRFDLLANYMDRTLLRNDVTYFIANKTTAMGWNPQGKFVEVVLNGKHIGNYYLCEHIKVSKNRVNITELEEDATEGEAITGGYIMELDTYYDETCKFKSAIKSLPWMFKDPDEVNEQQLAYMQQYVNDMEDALYDDTKFANREFIDYMDLESFADWFLVYELAGNSEPNHPKSCYMHKDLNGKIVAGPVWDFDWATFKTYGSWCNSKSLYYERLLQDEQFVSVLKERWAAQKADFELAIDYIESQGLYLSHSDEMNIALWPISLRVNNDETLTYAEAVAKMKKNYTTRLNQIDAKINSL